MKLIFVYNADSGLWNGLLDFAHKIVLPRTYACRLCAVTYGNTGMRTAWREFVHGLGVPVLFLHRDELHEQFGKDVKDVALPAAFIQEDNGKPLRVWIAADEMNACTSLEDLMKRVANHHRQLLTANHD
jgi:hypothetical protein